MTVPLGDFTTTRLANWLRSQVTSGARVVAGRLPDMPNRVIGIEMVPGPGLEMEGLFDILAFQLRSRGGENNLEDAEAIALEADRIFTGRGANLSKSENLLIKDGNNVADPGIYIKGMGRTGSRPSQLTIGDALSRYTFTCTYYAEVATNIGVVF